MKERRFALILASIIFLLSSIFSYLLKTDFLTVQVENFAYATPDGYTLRGTMYRPCTAMVESPAPAVITSAGGSDEHTQQSTINIELARRGYVVFSYDSFSHGQSDLYITDTMGALDMITYALSFNWVDSDRLAVEGHSNGGVFLAEAAIASGNVKSIVYSNVVPIDSDQPFLAVDTPINAAFILSQYDEYAGPSNWGVDTALDSVNIPRVMRVFGTEDTISTGVFYGDMSQNNLRILYAPRTTHTLAFYSSEVIGSIISFLDTSLDYQSTLSISNQIWPIYTVASCINMLCALVMLCIAIDHALDNPLFESLKKPPIIYAPHPRRMLVLLSCIACTFFSFVPFYLLGKRVLQVSLLYPQADTNGVVLWAITSSCIYIAMHAFFVKTYAREQPGENNYRDRTVAAPRTLLKTFLLAAIGFLMLYVVGDFIYSFSSSGFSFLWTSLIPLTKQKASIYICYFITFLPFFFCLNLLVTRFMDHPNHGVAALYAAGAYSLGIVALIGFNWAFLLMFNRSPVHYARFAISPLLYLLPVLPLCGVCCSWFYKRTGKIYLAAFLSCFIFTWLLVGRNSTFYF